MKRDRALQAAIDKVGVKAIAECLCISGPAVSQWERVPPGRVIAIEKLTGVPREELRPDLYPRRAA
jgi:DNA-binding transcriptional regulator YdaS (Cro superfamily)